MPPALQDEEPAFVAGYLQEVSAAPCKPLRPGICRLLEDPFWGKLSVERFPPGPLQRLLVPVRPPGIMGVRTGRTENFWREFEKNFLQKGSLKSFFSGR